VAKVSNKADSEPGENALEAGVIKGMGSKERREREKESLRQEILDAARELFAEQGYESVTMRKIAEKIEYSPTTIYLYFSDKDELLFSLCQETFSKLVKYIEHIEAQGSSDPVEKVKLGLRAYVDFGLKHPNHYKVTFMQSMRPRGGDLHEDKESMGHRAFEQLASLVDRCVKEGRFAQEDAKLISGSLWASAHGITSLLISNQVHGVEDHDRLIDMTIDSAVKGFSLCA
jgi:AcrR family transcriptional regulator